MAEQSLDKYPWLDPERLMDFLDELRTAGFAVGVPDYVKAQELVLRLLSNDVALDQPEQLGRYLGPLLCSSETEQVEFEQRFANWIHRLIMIRDAATQDDLLGQELEWIGESHFNLQTLALLTVFGIILAALTALWLGGYIERLDLSSLSDPRSDMSKFILDMLESVFDTLESEPDDSVEFPLDFFFLASLLTLGMLPMAWSIYIRWRARQYLERQPTQKQPLLESLSILHDTEPLFPAVVFFRLAERMRRRVRVDSDQLDIYATLNNTLDRGGWLMPIQGTRLQIPEYLVLIDRSTFQDHQTRLIEEMIAHLTEHEVFASIYYFDGDPRVCYPAAAQSRGVMLSTLAQSEGDKRLLIFTDAQRLFHPLRNDLDIWTDLFTEWLERVLLTTKSREQWGYYEEHLQSLMNVMPATSDSLNTFVMGDLLERNAHEDEYTYTLLPSLLTERPYRWLERDQPDGPIVEQVLLSLRAYLDNSSFFWLCACAIFPKIQWDITLYLGQVLTTDEGTALLTYERLVALARLPWFRHGYMPDWFRRYLIATLTPAQERDVRQSLHALLLNSMQGTVGQHQIEVARTHRRALDFLSHPVIRRLARQSGDNSPLQDHIFLTHMTRGRQLAVQLPVKLRDRLLSGSRRSLDWAIWLEWTFAHAIGGMLIPHIFLDIIDGNRPLQITLVIIMVYSMAFLQVSAGRQRIEPDKHAMRTSLGGMAFLHIALLRLMDLDPNLITGLILGLADSLGRYVVNLKRRDDIYPKPLATIIGLVIGCTLAGFWYDKIEEIGSLFLIWLGYGVVTGITLVWKQNSIFTKSAGSHSQKKSKQRKQTKQDVSQSILSRLKHLYLSKVRPISPFLSDWIVVNTLAILLANSVDTFITGNFIGLLVISIGLAQTIVLRHHTTWWTGWFLATLLGIISSIFVSPLTSTIPQQIFLFYKFRDQIGWSIINLIAGIFLFLTISPVYYSSDPLWIGRSIELIFVIISGFYLLQYIGKSATIHIWKSRSFWDVLALSLTKRFINWTIENFIEISTCIGLFSFIFSRGFTFVSSIIAVAGFFITLVFISIFQTFTSRSMLQVNHRDYTLIWFWATTRGMLIAAIAFILAMSNFGNPQQSSDLFQLAIMAGWFSLSLFLSAIVQWILGLCHFAASSQYFIDMDRDDQNIETTNTIKKSFLMFYRWLVYNFVGAVINFIICWSIFALVDSTTSDSSDQYISAGLIFGFIVYMIVNSLALSKCLTKSWLQNSLEQKDKAI